MLRIGTLTTAVLFILSLALYQAGAGDARTVFTLLAVTGIFLGLHYQDRFPRALRAAWVFALPVTAIGFALESAERVGVNLRKLPEWDYLGFWLHARTAVLGGDFYDPASAQALVAPYDVGIAFRREIVDVGFWYPPPTMFLFWPLGLADPAAALPWWYGLQVLAAVASVFLLRRLFFPGGGPAEWLACAALLCATHGTYETFHFSQTNFVALLLVLLFWGRNGTAAGGAWLASAVFVKPFIALLAFGPLIGRQWRAVLGFGLATVALLVASGLAFGGDALAGWLDWDRIQAKPQWIYSQPTNQSLLGLVLRSTRTACRGLECLTHPIFVSGAAVLAAATTALAVPLARAREHEWTTALFLLFALIVYPVSQLFYTVLLLPPALLAWTRRDRVPGGGPALAVVLGLVFALAALDRGRASVFAYLLMWGVIAAMGLVLVRVPRPAVTEAAAGVA